MINSMTGFAQRAEKTKWGDITWNLRSLNNRSLDISSHLPERFRPLEAKCRRQMVESFSRGRIDAFLQFVRVKSDLEARLLDEFVLQSLLAYSNKIREYAPTADGLTVAEILKWPGVIRDDDDSGEDLSALVLQSLARAIEDLKTDRGREGLLLEEVLRQKLQAFKISASEARTMVPQAQQQLQERLTEKMTQMDVEVEPGRWEQEVALLLVKLDVAEEIDRIDLHVAEFERVLAENLVAGKRLGFLLQELGREVNTLSSKTVHYPLNALAVDMKVTLEQMREQVQNVE